MQGSTLTNRPAAAAPAVFKPVFPRLRTGVQLVLLAFVLLCVLRLPEEPTANVFWAIVIAILALAPAYLWASGNTGGLPIFPSHLGALVLTSAVPLISGHPEISAASEDAISLASASVVLYAVVATLCWYAVMLRKLPRERSFRMLPMSWGYSLLLAVIVAGTVYNVLLVDNRITFAAGLYSIVRAVQMALTSIALFIIAIRLGEGGQSSGKKATIMALLGCFVLSQVATLYLGSAIVSTLAVIVATHWEAAVFPG